MGTMYRAPARERADEGPPLHRKGKAASSRRTPNKLSVVGRQPAQARVAVLPKAEDAGLKPAATKAREPQEKADPPSAVRTRDDNLRGGGSTVL